MIAARAGILPVATRADADSLKAASQLLTVGASLAAQPQFRSRAFALLVARSAL